LIVEPSISESVTEESKTLNWALRLELNSQVSS